MENRATRTGRWALSDRQVEDIIGEIKSIDVQLDAHEVWRGWIDTKIYRACGPLRTKLEFERSFASLPARMISALRTMTVFLHMRPVCWRLCDEVRNTVCNGTENVQCGHLSVVRTSRCSRTPPAHTLQANPRGLQSCALRSCLMRGLSRVTMTSSRYQRPVLAWLVGRGWPPGLPPAALIRRLGTRGLERSSVDERHT